MQKQIKLVGNPRKKQEKLTADLMPAVCYGRETESFIFSIKRNEFIKVLEEAGESHIINLEVGDKKANVLVKDVQHDAVKNFPIHADFYQVNMKEEVHAEITLEFIGESKLIKEQGGILVKSMDTVKVVCLPEALVDKIEVDISVIENLDDNLSLNDIKLPSGIKLDHYESGDIVIAMIAAPKKQEEEAPIVVPKEEEKKTEEKIEEKK
jgi:large subunit ribosomal protein L25